jgi:hypothetical protein
MTRHRLIRAAGVVVAVTLLVIGALYLRGIPGHTRPHQTVGARAQTLREAFNADARTVRIVALVSPPAAPAFAAQPISKPCSTT